MDYNYHTHTYRCSHATGTEEEYIRRAIECGIKYMGFSDHIPLVFPGGYESYYRIPIAEVENYFSDIKALREKYKDEIDIKIGFEMEYYPDFFEYMLKNAIEFGAEYLILGQHFIGNEYPCGMPSTKFTDSEEELKEYVSCVLRGIWSGVFTYVAHPDIFNFSGEDLIYEREMRKICKASREYNVPLEINFLGIREMRRYPKELFWKIAGEEKSPVTFGFDSHDAKNAYDGKSLLVAKEMVKKYNLNYIGKPEIKDIREGLWKA